MSESCINATKLQKQTERRTEVPSKCDSQATPDIHTRTALPRHTPTPGGTIGTHNRGPFESDNQDCDFYSLVYKFPNTASLEPLVPGIEAPGKHPCLANLEIP